MSSTPLPEGTIVALIDLSPLSPVAAETMLSDLGRADRLGTLVCRAIVQMPVGCAAEYQGPWSLVDASESSGSSVWAFDMAADSDAALLIVAGGAMPSAELVCQLLEAFALDPLFGVAVPRFVATDTGRVLLSRQFGPFDDSAPMRVLASLPDYQVAAECVAPVMLVRAALVGNLTVAVPAGHGLWPTLVEYTVRARRAGFRTVICNRAIANRPPSDAAAAWGCGPGSLADIRQAWPDLARVEQEHESSPAFYVQRVLGARFDLPHSLLLDARNLTEIQNGTSTVILSICDALHRARPDAEVTLWVHANVADHYDVAERYSCWRVSTTPPNRRYAAALRLSQPWYHGDLDVLVRLAAVNAYWMLDTIAWDVVYCAPVELDAVWQRMAAEADAVFFISDFSRERFINRFTPWPAVSLLSCPLSLEASDYLAPVGPRPPGDRYWLLVGNRYDHKHIGATVDLLSRAFPAQRMVVFGDRDQPRTNLVTQFDSGSVDSDAMHTWYAHADAVIFPSFYEGFGLPIVQGLAYDRTVVVRGSALVDELSGSYRGPGRLVTFETERALVHHLECLSRGELPTPQTPVAASGAPWTWDSAAAMLLAQIERLVAASPSAQLATRAALARGISHPYRRR